MKTRTLIAVLITVGTLCLSNAARALVLSYEDPLNPNYGKIYNGPIKINMINYDAGTLYGNLGDGYATGFSGSPTNTVGINGGVSGLDSIIPTTQASGAQATGSGYGISGKEDTWGIAKVTAITTPNGDIIWTPSVKMTEITAKFYGEQDFHISQHQTSQTIDGVGLHVDFYEDAARNFNPTSGTAVNAAEALYPTVTDGTLMLRTISVPDFIRNDGTEGGSATEFESTLNMDDFNGAGSAFLALYDPSTRDYGQFNSDFFLSLDGLSTADIQLQFTTTANTSPVVSDWLVRSSDPVIAVVPEPVQGTLLLIGVAILMLRRQVNRLTGSDMAG